MKMGVILGNRGFFADSLCLEGRKRLLSVLRDHGIEPVILPEDYGTYGSVQSTADALACADLFRSEREDIAGIIVSLPNFGDEKSVLRVLREFDKPVPILVHAFADRLGQLDYEHRRDAFCGKISVCNNLYQAGIPFSLTQRHTVDPETDDFARDLMNFAAVCRVVRAVRGARIGLLGMRPGDFNTVRFSEKILERHAVSVEPLELSDVIEGVRALPDADTVVQDNLKELASYMAWETVPKDSRLKLAKLLVIYRRWVREQGLSAAAVQCWDALQRHLGINPCLVMSVLSQERVPAACESDVAGALSMLILQAASEQPSALVDWNNNVDSDPDRVVLFHCGNFACDAYHTGSTTPSVSFPQILASTLGSENTYGAIEGRLKPGPVTFARIATDDATGRLRAYTAEGTITEDTLETFGSWGVAQVSDLQTLMQHICRHGFEHHVAINLSASAAGIVEALTTYLGWDVYSHQ